MATDNIGEIPCKGQECMVQMNVDLIVGSISRGLWGEVRAWNHDQEIFRVEGFRWVPWRRLREWWDSTLWSATIIFT